MTDNVLDLQVVAGTTFGTYIYWLEGTTAGSLNTTVGPMVSAARS